MDEKVKAIQERLRKQFSQSVQFDDRCAEAPLIAFEVVSGVPEGADTLVYRVVAELKRRGWRVANVRRFGVNTVPAHIKECAEPYLQCGSDATLVAAPDRTVLVRPSDDAATLSQMLEALGDGFDVILCESFEYLPIPKLLMTGKVQEGFNLGLPNVIGYVSSQADRAVVIPHFDPSDACGICDLIEHQLGLRVEETEATEDGAEVEGQ